MRDESMRGTLAVIVRMQKLPFLFAEPGLVGNLEPCEWSPGLAVCPFVALRHPTIRLKTRSGLLPPNRACAAASWTALTVSAPAFRDPRPPGAAGSRRSHWNRRPVRRAPTQRCALEPAPVFAHQHGMP
jgi:hypothetical protein